MGLLAGIFCFCNLHNVGICVGVCICVCICVYICRYFMLRTCMKVTLGFPFSGTGKLREFSSYGLQALRSYSTSAIGASSEQSLISILR